MSRKTSSSLRLAAAVVAGLLLWQTTAAAEPLCEDTSRCVKRLPDGATTPQGVILPPGYYLTNETWNRLDEEVRRLQEEEVRLRAERDSLTKSAQPPWLWVAAALAVGIATGLGVTLVRN